MQDLRSGVIYELENKDVTPDAMRFARTNCNRRRFLPDILTISYHLSSGRPGHPHAGSPRHRCLYPRPLLSPVTLALLLVATYTT